MELIELLSIDIDVAPIVELGDSGTGIRRLIPFGGGTFTGRDGLRGTLAAGGVDWQFVRSDGTLEIDAHYVLETDGGALIEVRSTGIRVAAPDVIERITAGDQVDPSEYYFRTHIRLTSPDDSLRWMNDVIAVSAGERRRASVRINVFELT